MNRGLLLVLLALALLAVGLAIVLERGSAGRQELGTGEILLPRLEQQVGELQELEVRYPGEEPILLYRTGEDWSVGGYDDYPVSWDKLSELVSTLAEMELEEAKTARPEYHADLGLSEPSEEEGGALQIRLLGAGGEVLADILFGDEAASRRGQYVRRSGEDQSWLVDRRLPDVPFEAWGWLQQPLLEISYERVREVRLSTEQGEQYRMYREIPAEKHLQLAELPAGRELSQEDVLDKYGALLESLRFTGIMPAGEAAFPQRASVTARVVTFNGLGIAAELARAEQEDANYAFLRLRFTLEEVAPVAVQEAPAAAEPAPGALQEGALTVPAIADIAPSAAELQAALPNTAARAEREQLEALHGPWVYQVDIEDFNSFEFNIDDVLKEEDKEEE